MEYKVSPDIREKEKIVGGHFTMTQTVFLGLALISGIGLGLFTYQATNNIPLAVFPAGHIICRNSNASA